MSEPRPNFLLVLLDDLGVGDVPCVRGGSAEHERLVGCDAPSWGHPFLEMPGLSRLQHEGTRFTQVYTQGLVCGPSRAALMTGLWPSRLPLGDDPGEVGLGRVPTVSLLLREAGYRVASFGKWNIGSDEHSPMGKDLIPPADTYGFETISGNGKPLVVPAAPAGRALHERNESEAHQRYWGRDTVWFEQASAWLRQVVKAAGGDSPFYCQVWPLTPHRPVPRKWSWLATRQLAQLEGFDERRFGVGMREKFKRHRTHCSEFHKHHGTKPNCSKLSAKHGGTAGMIAAGLSAYLGELYGLDHALRGLLATLDSLGRANDTVTLFTSDHGPEEGLLGEMGYTAGVHGSGARLQGGDVRGRHPAAVRAAMAERRRAGGPRRRRCGPLQRRLDADRVAPRRRRSPRRRRDGRTVALAWPRARGER